MSDATIACQCGRPGCGERLDVAGDEDAAAAAAARSMRVVAPGHAAADAVVVARHDAFWVVRDIDPLDADDDASALSFPASDPPPGPAAV